MRKGWLRIKLVGSRRRVARCYWGWPELRTALAVQRGELTGTSLSEIADWANTKR